MLLINPNPIPDDQLVMILWDMLLPTLSGSAIQLSMLLERMLLNPHVARKVQQELDEVVGQGRLPTLDDRINLPFTEATLREGLRIDTLVPSGISHVALEDTKLRGYDIPKGCFVMLGLDIVNNQREFWGDPENFRPERFLDERGNLSLRQDISVPFGAGKTAVKCASNRAALAVVNPIGNRRGAVCSRALAVREQMEVKILSCMQVARAKFNMHHFLLFSKQIFI